VISSRLGMTWELPLRTANGVMIDHRWISPPGALHRLGRR
jgi:hypothetical protein